MSYNDLSIPTDIPWKRLGASKDMIAEPDFQFPERWKSSISVFYHEPSQEEIGPSYCNRKITYLKVSCTLSNFQACTKQIEKELKLLDELRQGEEEFKVVDDLINILTTSYPC